jgi:hypothetical protein
LLLAINRLSDNIPHDGAEAARCIERVAAQQ